MSLGRINGYTAQETAALITRAGVEREALPFFKLVLKSFLGGCYICFGGHVNLLVLSGSPGLRESNPSLASMIAGFTFPLGFVLVILTNAELFTSSMFFMTFTVCQRKTTILGSLRVLVIGYVFNFAAALFIAGFFCWWSNTLETDIQKSYAVTQAEKRVNVQWSVNFLRGIGCNWFVSLAAFLACASNDHVSKIYSIWIPIWAFVIMGYQHCIANFYLIPIGMFYGTNFGVGKFIYQSIIPVTIGNIIGGAVPAGLCFWYLYGRNPPAGTDDNKKLAGEKQAEVDEEDIENASVAFGNSQIAHAADNMV